MKKRIGLGALLLLTAMLTAGCAMRTVDQMYCVPKRSQSFSHVQQAMDEAMTGLEYAAPSSGENQQTVQLADLDGDGVDEYLLFARDKNKTPLEILIFDTDEEETCFLQDVITLSGSQFERIEYEDVDDAPGLELIVGCQVSNQLMGNVSIYSFLSGGAEKLMSASYSQFLTCDLNRDNRSELLVVRPSEAGEAGESAGASGLGLRYEYQNGAMERSLEVPLSAAPEDVKRIVEGKLQSGESAVYLSSVVGNSAIATDILTVKDGLLINLTSTADSVPALRNYFVYAGDIDGDGITELPMLFPMRPVTVQNTSDPLYLIGWYSMDLAGEQHSKQYTFHDYSGGWYLELNPQWADRISAEKEGNSYRFFLWDKDGVKVQSLFTIYAFTGSSRDQQAAQEDRFPLYRTESTAYAAELHRAARGYGITEEHMVKSFHLIQQAWKTGET